MFKLKPFILGQNEFAQIAYINRDYFKITQFVGIILSGLEVRIICPS